MMSPVTNGGRMSSPVTPSTTWIGAVVRAEHDPRAPVTLEHRGLSGPPVAAPVVHLGALPRIRAHATVGVLPGHLRCLRHRARAVVVARRVAAEREEAGHRRARVRLVHRRGVDPTGERATVVVGSARCRRVRLAVGSSSRACRSAPTPIPRVTGARPHDGTHHGAGHEQEGGPERAGDPATMAPEAAPLAAAATRWVVHEEFPALDVFRPRSGVTVTTRPRGERGSRRGALSSWARAPARAPARPVRARARARPGRPPPRRRASPWTACPIAGSRARRCRGTTRSPSGRCALPAGEPSAITAPASRQ